MIVDWNLEKANTIYDCIDCCYILEDWEYKEVKNLSDLF